MEKLESKGRRIMNKNSSRALPLPSHIIQVIFSKLSISNLPACRLVCQAWNHLILESKFIPNSSFLLCTSDVLPNLPDCNPTMRCIDIDTMNYVSSFGFDGDWSTISVFNSCNGLLFISRYGDDHFSDGILNPMTNEFFKLPGPELEPIFHFGLGFRPQTTKGYKLFNVTSLRTECTSVMNVFTFGRGETNHNLNCWRQLHSLPFGICDHGVYLDGVLYWIGKEKDQETKYFIYVLDVETEQIESTAVLEVGPLSKRAILQLFNGTMYAIIFTPDKIQVWRMIGIHSWVKGFVIDHHTPPRCPCEHQFLFFRLLKVSEDGEIWFLIGDVLFYMDKTGKKKIKVKKFNPNEVLVTGGCHIESLNFGSLQNILVGDE